MLIRRCATLFGTESHTHRVSVGNEWTETEGRATVYRCMAPIFETARVDRLPLRLCIREACAGGVLILSADMDPIREHYREHHINGCQGETMPTSPSNQTLMKPSHSFGVNYSG